MHTQFTFTILLVAWSAAAVSSVLLFGSKI